MASERDYKREFIRAEAIHDQAIAAADAWCRKAGLDGVAAFWCKINESEPEDLRGMSDNMLKVLAAFAKIGIHEVLARRER